MYPECPLTKKMTELNRSSFNMVGQYIKNFEEDFCSFEIFTDDPNLENTTIPMKISVDPFYGSSGDATIFNIFIQPVCGEVNLEPVLLPNTFYNTPLWSPVEIIYDPFYADLNCGATSFQLVQLDINGFIIDEQNDMVVGTPIDRVTQPGTYDFAIQSQVESANNGIFTAQSEPITL